MAKPSYPPPPFLAQRPPGTTTTLWSNCKYPSSFSFAKGEGAKGTCIYAPMTGDRDLWEGVEVVQMSDSIWAMHLSAEPLTPHSCCFHICTP